MVSLTFIYNEELIRNSRLYFKNYPTRIMKAEKRLYFAAFISMVIEKLFKTVLTFKTIGIGGEKFGGQPHKKSIV